MTTTPTGENLERSIVLSWDLALGDLNQDGLPDIALAETELDGPPPHPGFLTIILQDAAQPGTFQVGITHRASLEASSIGIADLDADGLPDAVIGSHALNADGIADRLTLFLQRPQAAGQLIETRSVEMPSILNDLQIADVNGDGFQDIVTTGGFETIVMLNDPRFAGSFVADQVIARGATSLALGDIDSDGFLDLALDRGSVETTSSVYLQEDGWFRLAEELDAGISPREAVLANIDADDRLDLIVANGRTEQIQDPVPSVSVFLQEREPFAAGTFRPPVRYPADNHPVALSHAIAIADFDGDGMADVATIASDASTTKKDGTVTAPDPKTNVAVFLQSAAGAFSDPELYLIDESVWDLKAGDMNGDGLSDIVLSAAGAKVMFNRPTSPGTFAPAETVGTIQP